jgi:hypothetical protein
MHAADRCLLPTVWRPSVRPSVYVVPRNVSWMCDAVKSSVVFMSVRISGVALACAAASGFPNSNTTAVTLTLNITRVAAHPRTESASEQPYECLLYCSTLQPLDVVRCIQCDSNDYADILKVQSLVPPCWFI